MTSTVTDFDAIVLGGGFYGCCIALLLTQSFPRVALIEKDQNLLQRASAINQARVHGGYHYPRSIMTAARSLLNLPRFSLDFSAAISDDFTTLYGIARYGSKISAAQYRNFFRQLGASIDPAPAHLRALFNPLFIEDIFVVKEFAFDCEILRDILHRQLDRHKVNLFLETEAARVEKTAELLTVRAKGGPVYQSKIIFNCLYSCINVIRERSSLAAIPLRHEITEMVLVDPGPFAELGITIMDGAFFSLMPYPSRGLHTLSHVRYTPHESWTDEHGVRDGYAILEKARGRSNFGYMQRDAARYVPLIGELRQVESLFEIKTVLPRNETDDGRPILFREERSLPGFFTVMGGKIDNIYDILEIIAETKPSLGLDSTSITKLFCGCRTEGACQNNNIRSAS